MKGLKLNNISLAVILLAGFVINSCVPISQSVVQAPSFKYNFSSMYNPGEKSFNPECRIFLSSDTTAIVFYKISVDELKNIAASNQQSDLKMTIKYVVRETTDFRVVDSSVIVHTIVNLDNEDLKSYFQIKLPKGLYCKLLINMSLGNSSNLQQRVIYDIDNNNIYSKDRFVFYEVSNSKKDIKYCNLVNPSKDYIINSNFYDNFEVTIEYYKFPEYVCVPPYYLYNSTNDLRQPDSVFVYLIGDKINFSNEGYYVLKPVVNANAALCFINGGDFFPEVKTLLDMLEPLKLITGNKEYKELKELSNLKIAIDEFWLSKSNNMKFAKEQIRVFYNRVYLANKYFSEDIVGWKTDRGNIYVLFGPPSIVNISATGEEWFYGKDPNVAGVLFVFDKTNNIYSGTTYILRRDSNYQSVWSQAVTTWRDGRIFTITN
ncbi:MAG: GWxTD domain-containing protein [Bacteroidales bacterium]|nr:GWxTD domain-containing protein [Bacteroidales bacterium]MDD3858788.1 GWxTD domain-containing protein [Bacteroidales bacterium]